MRNNNPQDITYLHVIGIIAQNVLFHKRSDLKIKILYYIWEILLS